MGADRAALIPEIAARRKPRSSGGWIWRLEERAVPCGPINAIAQVFADAEVRRAAWGALPGNSGAAACRRNPVRMALHDSTAPKARPLLGEDTDEV